MLKSNIGKKIYLLLAIGIIALTTLSFFSNYLAQKNAIKKNSIEKVANYKISFHDQIEKEAFMIQSYLSFLEENKTLKKHFIKSQKGKLYTASKDIYNKLNLNNEITHFYFIKPNGKVLLRVHDFARDGDMVNRYTFKESKKTNSLYYGIEFGLKKNYTLRVVTPWYIDNKLIGYIEIGKEIDKIINSLSKQFRMEIFFAINKNEYTNSAKFIQKRLEKSLQTKNHFIVYHTMETSYTIASSIDQNSHLQCIDINKKHYFSSIENLEDISQKKLGKILYLVDITKPYNHLQNSLLLFLLILIVGSFSVLIIGYFFTRQQQKNLNKLLIKLQSKQKKLQLSHQENKNLLSLFDKSDSVLFRWNNDQKWSIDYVSSNVEKLLGFSKKEFLNSEVTYIQCIYPGDLEHVFWEVEQGKNSKGDFFKHDPYRIITKNGIVKWVLDYTVLSKNKNGEIIHFLGYIIDITDRELSKNKILEQKQEFETIFNYAQDGIAIIDTYGNFLNCNDEFLKMMGYTKEEIYKKNCSDLTSPEFQEKNNLALQKAIELGSIENIDKSCIIKDGGRISVNMSISLLPDKKRLLLLLHDTTSLKIVQEQTKLASMGEMIGNIAHQWRQPLSIITTSASGMKMQAEFGQTVENQTIVNFSDLIVKQAQYLSKTIDNFRNFIKHDTEYSNISIKSALEQTLGLVDATLKDNYINLITNFQDDCILDGNTNEICEAFINIINNSKDI